MKKATLLALLSLLSSLTFSSAQDKKRTGIGPVEDSLKAMKIHEGLEVTFWAGEPGLINPTDMDVDERGRVWVVESMNYRGSKLRPEGDRILIMEDTKGSGKADSYKTFYQDPSMIGPLGITVLGNKVYVAQSPKMWVFTIDASGDKAVGPPEVLFDGFTGVNHDHGLHSIMFGPDGRYYFNSGNEGCHGQVKNGKGEPVVDSTGSEIGDKGTKWRGGPRGGAGQHYTQGMAFRCNPDGSGFEVLGHNFRNNYEVCSDSFGTAWQSDNDDDGNQGVRINYVMEGGNFGYVGFQKDTSWGRDQTAYPGQSRQEAHWHQRDPGVVPNLLMTGGGSPTGILVYEGDLLPGMNGKLIHCDAGPNVVRVYTPIPAGAGYKCDSVDLLRSSDRWFRPADVCVGPQGEVYIADWTDPGVGGHATGDKDPATISGRIYRVAPPGFKVAPTKLDLATVKGQIEALLSPNLARRFLGYEKLANGGADAVKALEDLYRSSKDARHRARAVWLLARSPGGAKHVKEALKDKEVDVRCCALRAARLIKMDMLEIAKEMIHDSSFFVARELCLALSYESAGKCMELLVALGDKVQPQNSYEGIANKDFALQEAARQEKYVPKWYLEAFGIACMNREKEVLEAWTKNGKNKDPKVAEAIAWRLNREIPVAPPPPPKK